MVGKDARLIHFLWQQTEEVSSASIWQSSVIASFRCFLARSSRDLNAVSVIPSSSARDCWGRRLRSDSSINHRSSSGNACNVSGRQIPSVEIASGDASVNGASSSSSTKSLAVRYSSISRFLAARYSQARGFSISQNCLNERGHAGIALAEDLLLFRYRLSSMSEIERVRLHVAARTRSCSC